MSVKKEYLTALLTLLLVLAALCIPASALYFEDLHTVKSDTVKGGVYVGGGHGSDDSPYTQNFSVPNGTILWSRLYVGVTGGGHSDGWLNITYCNGTGNTQNNQYLEYEYDGSDNDETAGYYVGCGRGYYCKYWNVTDITNNGANSATVTTNGFSDGRINGIAIITVYNDGGENVTYWLNQGYIQMGDVSHYPCCVPTGTTWFNGTMDTNINATLWTIYITGTAGEWDYLYFNSNNFSTNDAADGGGSTPDDIWSAGKGFDIDAWTVDKTWLNQSNNNVTFQNNYLAGGERGLRAVGAVLINKEPKPDLNVSEINSLVERDGQTPIALVANHTYSINVTVINIGSDATGFNVTLHENGTLRNGTYLSGLEKGAEKVVQFNWTNLSGVYELNVTADANGTVNESDETNNANTKIVTVLDDIGAVDLVISEDDITFLPAYGWHTANNNTLIKIKVTNNGTADAGNTSNKFKVQLIVDGVSTNKTTWLRAKSYQYVEFERAILAGVHSVEVQLDPDGNVTESDYSNNTAVKSLKIISCGILNSHHYGNMSAYNGILSNYTTVNMFDIMKLAPENTTPVDLLESVANVTLGIDGTPRVIDGLKNGKDGGKYHFLTPFVNGIPISWHNWTTYPLRNGDVLHWDIFAFISESKFRPRLIMDYPEPFLHGYNGTVWNTTIVYPDELCYRDKANAIRDKINTSGVPGERVSVKSVENVTEAEKENNNLILLGTPSNNPLIADVNSQHLDVGLPVYFRGKQMIDDSDDTPYDFGAVVAACDNPYDGANWRDTGPCVWLAAAVEDYWAYKAADLLASDTSNLNRFWVIRKPYLIPIWDGTNVTLDWRNWTGGSTFDIYITNNLTAGFPATPSATTTEKSWTDVNAADDDPRYYKVMNKTIEGEVCKITYNLEKGAITGVNWISLPNTNLPITNADELIKDIQNCTKVAWWNSTSQKAESYSEVPFPPFYVGTNFEIKPARGYEVAVTADTSWTVVGWIPPICPLKLKKGAISGVNWICMPFNTTIDDADGLIKDIQNCTKVAWWNATSQKAESYSEVPFPPYYVGTNFEVKPAKGYEVAVTDNTTWMPH